LKFCDSPPLPAVAFVFSGNLIATAEQQCEPVALLIGQRRPGGNRPLDGVGKFLGGVATPEVFRAFRAFLICRVAVLRALGSGQFGSACS
jgi:hypothetical protein